MRTDFQPLIETGSVWVIEADGINGYIVMYPKDDALFVENVAVDPVRHGFGLGGQLLEFAEDHAVAIGLSRITLYTNIHMTENRSFYPALGYAETARRVEEGFERVYFEKAIRAE